jgi:uncharacterized membrane protein
MTSADSLVRDYLGRLESGLAGIPRAGRREVLDEITAHIAEARAELPEADELGVRNLLDRLGEPAEIAAEARERFGVRRVQTTWREAGALILLPLPLLGWLVGVILLWISDAWSRLDKVIGMLLIPAGALVTIRIWSAGGNVNGTTCSRVGDGPLHCNSWEPSQTVLFVFGIAAALGAEVYLIWRLRRRCVIENRNGA